jgi:cyclopropane-fatty-acyl-phospholipid synthase
MDLGSVVGSVAMQTVERTRAALLCTSALSPVMSIARRSVLSSLNKIEKGSLTIVIPNSEKMVFGEDNGLSTILTVHNDKFWMRIFLSADLVSTTNDNEEAGSKDKSQGFAESYMLEEVSCSNLLEFFEVRAL